MAELFEQVTNFFDRQEWNSEILEGRTTLTMRVTMPAGTWDVFVDVRETEAQLTIYSVAPFNVPKEKLAAITANIPFEKRMTTSTEIANSTVFLLSPRSSHTTGQIVYVDGGYTHLDRSIS